MGLPLFANKTFANNWRTSSWYIGESSLEFRQLANFQLVYWRKFTRVSPIGELPAGILAKVHSSFANWRTSSWYIGESSLEFRQLVKFQEVYWRKFTRLFPVNTRQYQDISYESSTLHVL